MIYLSASWLLLFFVALFALVGSALLERDDFPGDAWAAFARVRTVLLKRLLRIEVPSP